MVRPVSHLSDASKDAPKAGKTLERPSTRVTTLGKSVRINCDWLAARARAGGRRTGVHRT
jgi:hypothetical protein